MRRLLWEQQSTSLRTWPPQQRNHEPSIVVSKPKRSATASQTRVRLAIGLAFGAGRLLPVVALAPTAGTERGAAVHAAMAERPQILRSLRAVDALAMAACALVLVV